MEKVDGWTAVFSGEVLELCQFALRLFAWKPLCEMHQCARISRVHTSCHGHICVFDCLRRVHPTGAT